MSQVYLDRIGDTVVSCSRGALSRDDLTALANELADDSTHTYVAGAAGDVSLDATCRNLLYDLLRKRGIRVLAVSDSKVVRGIITAAVWMGVSIESKSWREVTSAEGVDPRALDILLRQRNAFEEAVRS